MKIELKPKKIKEIYKGFVDSEEEGVFAFEGNLSIRPPYQREFVYNEEKQKAVIDTIIKGFPLNTFYWVKTGEDKFEVLDGQQRTLSIMNFLKHKFVVKYNGHDVYEDTLPDDIYENILNYSLMVYECEGTESEKLDWFNIVNTGGMVLTKQEIRNSVYTGEWLSSAKKYFSKRNCVAYNLGGRYIKGTPERQELLESALKGISEFQELENLEIYMSNHKSDEDANELWQYFQDVINWIEKYFEKYYEEMKGLDWCHYYNKYRNKEYNSLKISEEVKNLMKNKNVQDRKGIFEYILDYGNPFRNKHLNLRTFDTDDMRKKYEEQKGICKICGEHFEIEEMEGDHIIPWSQGGTTEYSNLQMLCKSCNRQKSNN